MFSKLWNLCMLPIGLFRQESLSAIILVFLWGISCINHHLHPPPAPLWASVGPALRSLSNSGAWTRACSHNNFQFKPSEMTQSLQSLWQAAMSHSFRQLRLFFLAKRTNLLHIQHPCCLSLLSHQAGLRCPQKGMTHTGHPRSAGSAWAERGQGQPGPHWERALELKGTFWRGKSEKWVFCFGRMAQLQVQRRKFSKCHDISWRRLIVQ